MLLLLLPPVVLSLIVAVGSMPMATTTIPSIRLNNGMTWSGSSRAGEATSFWIPERRWMFDCGALFGGKKRRPSCLFLTHTHADHIQALTQVLFAIDTSVSVTVYFPAAAETALRAHLLAFSELIRDDTEDDADEDLEVTFNFKLVPLQFGQELSISPNVVLRTVECIHRKVCMGYSLFERKTVLKEEYRHLAGPELGKLARTGVVFKEQGPLEPILCFLGDTTAEAFVRHPEILEQHDFVAVECTFLDEEDTDSAGRTKHMHWNDVLHLSTTAKATTVFLVQHFSLKHKDKQWLAHINTHNRVSGRYNLHGMLARSDQDEACNCMICLSRERDD